MEVVRDHAQQNGYVRQVVVPSRVLAALSQLEICRTRPSRSRTSCGQRHCATSSMPLDSLPPRPLPGFQALAFDPVQCRTDLDAFRRLLLNKAELSERDDILPFFSGPSSPIPPPWVIQPQYPHL